jgi:hypothetical protein
MESIDSSLLDRCCLLLVFAAPAKSPIFSDLFVLSSGLLLSRVCQVDAGSGAAAAYF